MPPWLLYSVAGLLAVVGLAILTRALILDRARGRRRCRRCWYDMAGTTGLTCPECGRIARGERDLRRTRRRWPWAVCGLVPLAVASSMLVIGPAEILDRALWLVPSRAWALILPQFDEQALGLSAWSSGRTIASGDSRWRRLLAARRIALDVRPWILEGVGFSAPGFWMEAVGDEYAVLTYMLLDTLRHPYAQVRLRAAETFLRMYPLAGLGGDRSPYGVPTVIVGIMGRLATDDPNQSVRSKAIRFLRRAAPVRAIVPSLVTLLADPGAELVVDVIELAEHCGPAAEAVVPRLVELLNDDRTAVRMHSCRALGAIGSARALPALIDRLSQDDNGAIRYSAAEAIARIAPTDTQVIRALGGALHDDHLAVRFAAVHHLDSIGHAAAIVRADLRHAANDPNHEIADPATRALSRIDSRR